MLAKFAGFRTHTLDAIGNGTVYFSRRHQFNDPMDCNPPIRAPTLDALEKILPEWCLRLEKVTPCFIDRITSKEALHYLNNVVVETHYQDRVREMAKETGVFCATPLDDHPLMWGHYADGYRGFCIKYDLPQTNLIFEATNSHFEGDGVTIKNVKYDDGPVSFLSVFAVLASLVLEEPEYRNEEGCLDGNSVDRLFDKQNFIRTFYHCCCMEFLAHKHSAWSYEEEVRYLALHKNGQSQCGIRKLKQARIKTIIFGPEMPQNHRLTIERLVGSPAVEYLEAIYAKDRLGMDFRPAW